ncbi:hypothetical protein [Streptomyces flaveolus]|uniref:hypothetical protein n=1 Tax=Streptomyces flaveolus TaxID=67297 RepID=UPI00370267EF
MREVGIDLGRDGRLEFEELDLEVGDAFVGEAPVRASSLKPFLERAVFLCHLLNTALEGGVLGGEVLE